jgi:two-component system sensor histidine kinase EvgS
MMTRTMPYFLLLLALQVCAGAAAAEAQELAPTPSDTASLTLAPGERAWLEDHPVLRYGIDPAWPPFEFEDEEGRHRGMTADYARRLEEMLGVRFQRVDFESWSGVLRAAEEARIDLIFSLVKTEQRERYLAFSRPFTAYPSVVVTRLSSPFLSGVKDLARREVAVVKDYYLNDLLVAEEPGIRLRPEEDVASALAAVRRGDAFAYVGNLSTTAWILRSRGWNDLKVAARLEQYPLELAVAVRKDYAPLAGILSKGIAAIPQGERDEIFQRWIAYAEPAGLSWEQLRPWVFYTAGALLVVGGLILWRYLSLSALSRKLRREVAQRRRAQAEREEVIERLEEALANVKALSGLIPICSHCKKIRDDRGYWNQLESYLARHSEVQLSHGICPDCRDTHWGWLDDTPDLFERGEGQGPGD